MLMLMLILMLILILYSYYAHAQAHTCTVLIFPGNRRTSQQRPVSDTGRIWYSQATILCSFMWFCVFLSDPRPVDPHLNFPDSYVGALRWDRDETRPRRGLPHCLPRRQATVRLLRELRARAVSSPGCVPWAASSPRQGPLEPRGRPQLGGLEAVDDWQ